MNKPQVNGRIQIIDAVRGLCVVLMVLHHLMYDLVVFLEAPAWLFTNPILDVAHLFFAGMFIFLSGVSSDFSRSNVKRGAKVIAVALAITLVTYLMNMTILFGILHFLGFAMLFYGLTRKLWDLIPRWLAPVIYIAALAGTAIWINQTGYVSCKWLWMFGFQFEGFASADYFPILPWIFVFLLGTWAGKYIKERRLPGWFYRFNVPVLPQIGRKALIIYIVHQPVLYGAVLLIRLIASRV